MHFVSTFTCTSDAGLLPHFKTPRTPTACSRIGSTSETIISRANKIRNIGSAIFSLNNSEQSNYPNKPNWLGKKYISISNSQQHCCSVFQWVYVIIIYCLKDFMSITLSAK